MMTSRGEGLKLEEIEGIDTAGLVAWALGVAAEQVRQGLWNTEVDTSDPNEIADALQALAWQADAQAMEE